MLSCLGSGPATGWSLVQGVQPSEKLLRNRIRGQALNGLEEPLKKKICSATNEIRENMQEFIYLFIYSVIEKQQRTIDLLDGVN
jgi:hypothetical protein